MCLSINQEMNLSDSSRVSDTEIWMTYRFSVITMPLDFQNNVIYTGPVYKQEEDSMGSPSGDMLCVHLAGAAVHFHISNFSAQTATSPSV